MEFMQSSRDAVTDAKPSDYSGRIVLCYIAVMTRSCTA